MKKNYMLSLTYENVELLKKQVSNFSAHMDELLAKSLALDEPSEVSKKEQIVSLEEEAAVRMAKAAALKAEIKEKEKKRKWIV